MSVEKLIENIKTTREAHLLSRISRYPRNQAYLSDIGDCDRQIVYGILNWNERAMFNTYVKALLDVGKQREKEVNKELLEMGYNVILQQQIIEVKGRSGELLARGKIDGGIEYERVIYPLEIKSMDSNLWRQINTLDDFTRKPHLRKYIRQLQMYLFGHNKESGMFLIDDCRGHWKLIPVYLDYGECEYILQRLERAHQHIKDKTYPDRINYDPRVCDKCPFVNTCMQDIINKPMDMIENPELEADIARCVELKPLASEYDSIYKNVKEATSEVEKVTVGGRFMLINIPGTRKTYEVPQDIKDKYLTTVPTKTLKIQVVGEPVVSGETKKKGGAKPDGGQKRDKKSGSDRKGHSSNPKKGREPRRKSNELPGGF